MTEKDGVAKLRRALGLSQVQFGHLFGVHPMTVSKWERGRLRPNAYQFALMTEYRTAARKKNVKGALETALVGAGIAAAMLLLLQAAKGK